MHYGTAPYTLARLNRDRPDLADRVRAGELSTNAAAIEAPSQEALGAGSNSQAAAEAYDADNSHLGAVGEAGAVKLASGSLMHQ